MDKEDLTPKHVLPVFVILFMFVLMAVRGESGPFPPSLYAPTAEDVCECDRDRYDCADFRSRRDAQKCHDYCQWLMQTDDDVHGQDADGDGVVCGSWPTSTPVPGVEEANQVVGYVSTERSMCRLAWMDSV